jgi:DedD protein
MAFFKFRFPGKASEAAAEGLAPAAGESMEVLRRRARHRLFGSVVLVFIAVVAFPLLFDSQPRPVAVDTPIVIPDRNSTTPLSAGTPVPVSQTPAKPLLPAASAPVPSSAVPAQASLDPKEEVVPPSSPAAAAHEAPNKPAATPAPPKTEAKAEVRPDPANDGQKAKALLEGKSPAADQPRMIIQVGAFADADKVREVRRKLESAGLKTYTQMVEGKDGKRTTRVRVGPFDSRAEADKAAARIRKLDLQANLIVL